jgi:hypothetical protein
MLPDGRHTLGPDTGTLQVRTSREGAYAKAGHDLVMDVSKWEGTLAVAGERVSLELIADPRSLNVRWGFNGSNSLTDKDRASISETIDSKVLRGAAIRFRSTSVTPRGEALLISGDLTIGTATSRISFELRSSADGSRADAVATITQSDFAIKPYSAMLGTLKVRDAVEVVARATLPLWSPPVVWEDETPADDGALAETVMEEQTPMQEGAPAFADAVAAPVFDAPVAPVAPEPELEPAGAPAGALPPAYALPNSAYTIRPTPVTAYEVAGEPNAGPPRPEHAAPAAEPAGRAPHSGGLRLRWPR